METAKYVRFDGTQTAIAMVGVEGVCPYPSRRVEVSVIKIFGTTEPVS